MHIWDLQRGLQDEVERISLMLATSEKYYKIIHNPTSLFKASGINGFFNKVGKLWRGQTLKSHLSQFKCFGGNRPLTENINRLYNVGDGYKLKFDIDECEVIEYELVARRTIPLKEFIENEMGKKQ